MKIYHSDILKHVGPVVIVICAIFTLNAQPDDDLWDRFISPSDESKTKVWWFHGETETTTEGIDADLESFREKGVGGVVFYDQVHGKTEGAFPSMSPQWWEMLKYSALKARELGLSFEIAVSNGYVAGGPWITPELAMKQTAFSDTVLILDHDGFLDVSLPAPGKAFVDVATVIFPESDDFSPLTIFGEEIRLKDNEQWTVVYPSPDGEVEINALSYFVSPRGKGSTGSMNIPGRPSERYFGAKYTELPPIGTLEYSSDSLSWYEAASLPGVEAVIGHKSRRRTLSFPAVRGRYFRVRLHDWMDQGGQFPSLTVRDIRAYTRDMTDNIEVRSGLRTEVTYPTAVGGDKGAIPLREVLDVTDKTDGAGHLSMKLGKGRWHIIRFGYMPTGAKTKHGRKNMLGYEADVMSSDAVRVHFNHYAKAISDTLSAIGVRPQGVCMDSHEAGIQNWTGGFEDTFKLTTGYDIRPWIPALAGYIVNSREETERMLLDFRKAVALAIAENYYGTFASLCADEGLLFTSQSMLNICNDNLASRGKVHKPQGEFWAYQKDGNYDCLDAASAAHIYGARIASAEAFTDTPYEESWDELLRIANLAYCKGINEFVVCASSYQPWLDRKYDDSASSHPYVFHRHHPRWQSSQPFWAYQARCTELLRLGDPVVDLCVYIGEDVPCKTFSYKLPLIPAGYNFDVCSADALLRRFDVEDGHLSVDGGMTYKVLIVQDRTYISPEVESKLQMLKAAGAKIIRCDRGEDPAVVLRSYGILPDVSLPGITSRDDRINFYHRKLSDADIYFVYNHSPEAYSADVLFSGARSSAEVWDPVMMTKGKAEIRTSDNTVKINLGPWQSRFYVFRQR